MVTITNYVPSHKRIKRKICYFSWYCNFCTDFSVLELTVKEGRNPETHVHTECAKDDDDNGNQICFWNSYSNGAVASLIIFN